MKEELEVGNAYLDECIEARRKHGPLSQEDMIITAEPGAEIQLLNGKKVINQTGDTIEYIVKHGSVFVKGVSQPVYSRGSIWTN